MSTPMDNWNDLNVEELVATLLAEPFAQSNQFETTSLEELGTTIEEWREQLEAGAADGNLVSQRQSFDNCVSLYCLLLMKMDGHGVSASEPLVSLLKRSDPSPIAEVPEATPRPEPELVPVDKPGLVVIRTESLDLTQPPPEDSSFTKSSLTILLPPMGARAKEYYQMAEHFRAPLSTETTLSPWIQRKLAGHGFCYALEIECVMRMAEVVKKFWPQREGAIRALLDNASRKFELHASLKKAIEQWSLVHGEWLQETKFPHAAVLSSLRYMLATQTPEKYHPSLIETGMMILFFGQDSSAHGFPLMNLLGLTGWEGPEAIEFMFRMSRMHRLKNRVVSPVLEVDEAHLQTMEKEVRSLMKLLARVRFEESHTAGLKVA